MFSGNFFGIGGSVESGYKLQFYWEPKHGEIIATALPYSMFRFIIDETKDIPTIEFIFDQDWLNDGMFSIDYGNSARYPNLNSFVLSDKMLLAKVRISRKTLEKEVYLPKPK